MTLPGTSVSIRDEASPPFLDFDTGAAFVVGLASRGPTDAPAAVKSIAGYVAGFGERAGGSVLYDWLDVFYREGGSTAYVLRLVGDGAATSAVNLPHTGSGDPVAFNAEASSPGAWGDDLSIVIADGDAVGTYTLTVKLDGETVESSPDLADNDEAVAWAERSAYIALTKQGEDNPDNGTYTLTGGDDDLGSLTDDDYVDALAKLTDDYGPGQVAVPGKTSDAVHIGLLEHANAHTRVALLDLQDASSASTLAADVNAVRATAGARFAAAFAPHAVVPGIAAGTTRTVGYSAVQAGLIARLDGVTGNPNQAAAGENGRARYAIDLSQPAWTDADRELLNDAGVNVARVIRGEIRTYGYRTIVNPVTDPRWVEFSGSREVMSILSKASAVGESYAFAQLDGRGHTVADFQGELIGICAEEYANDALFGETPEEAYSVDVSANTDATAAERRLIARFLLRTSPFAERVEIELVKRLTTESV
jgi:hypothetical protein